MGELWPLLLSAQENIAGIPSAFLEQKKEEIKQRQIEQEKLATMKKQDEEKDKKDKEDKENREKRDRSRSPKRRKSRSPSPRRRSPARRERKRSPSRSPRRRTRSGSRSASPLTTVKKPEQLSPEPDLSLKERKESPAPEATSTSDILKEIKPSTPDVKETLLEQPIKKEKERKKKIAIAHVHDQNQSLGPVHVLIHGQGGALGPGQGPIHLEGGLVQGAGLCLEGGVHQDGCPHLHLPDTEGVDHLLEGVDLPQFLPRAVVPLPLPDQGHLQRRQNVCHPVLPANLDDLPHLLLLLPGDDIDHL